MQSMLGKRMTFSVDVLVTTDTVYRDNSFLGINGDLSRKNQ